MSRRKLPLPASTSASLSEMTAGLPTSAGICWHPQLAVRASALSVHVAMLHSAERTGQYTVGMPPFAEMLAM